MSLVVVEGVVCLENVFCVSNFGGLNFAWLSLTVLISFVSSTLNFPKSLVNSKLSNPRNFILLWFSCYFDQDFHSCFISLGDFEKTAKIIKALALHTILTDTNFVKVCIVLLKR